MAGTDENVYEVDASVGTIVWVRRRNGSWWPGRILGEEELSASHLMSPRSGTPVKLLGRDDASVDWYNLEKSKRVKPFRCGEFDDSIEKAERAQGAAIKKREKYARREDAILHALELEREQYEMKQQKLGITKRTRRRVPSAVKRALSGHSKLVHSKAQSLSKVRASSYEEESMDNPLYVQKAKHGKQRQEDASSEAVPRMRGLQDFGLRTAPSKRKLSPSEGSENHFSEYNHVPDLPSGSPVMEGVNPANPLALKRKAQGGLLEESLAKRRDRRRPLVQVLQSTAMLPTPDSLQPDADASLSVRREQEHSGSICRAKRSQCVYLPSDSNDHLDHTEVSSDQMQLSPSEDYQPSSGSSTDESTSSETLDEVESDSSEGGSVNSETDGEMDVLSDFTQPPTVAEPRTSEKVYMANGCVQGQTESMSSEDIDESAVNDYMPRPRLHDQIASSTADVGVSKWQLKGKRNTRNLLKRPVQIGGKISNGSIYGAYLEDKENGLKNSIGQRRYPGSSALNYEYDEDVFIEKSPMQSQMPGFGNRRYPPPFKGRSNPDIIDSEEDPIWEAERRPQAALRGYWDESAGYDPNPMYVNNHRYGRGKKTMLIDVDVKARATYQGEHVPLVSLMSRLNGKAIIGHPIQIEPLEDGSTDALVSGNYDFIAEPIDGSTTLKPVWRTGRRTAMQRVPRPHRFTALNEDEDGDPSEDFDLEGYQKSHGRHQYPKTRKASYSKKPMKKASLSSQKTRMLSSISIDQRHGGKGGTQRLVNKFSSFENGPTTVTCIPVKLVFSRLMEAVGRPPSRPPKQIITSTNGDTERKSA